MINSIVGLIWSWYLCLEIVPLVLNLTALVIYNTIILHNLDLITNITNVPFPHQEQRDTSGMNSSTQLKLTLV